MNLTPVPFDRLVRVEVRKHIDTRSGRWLIAAIGSITALGMVAVVWWGDAQELTFESLANKAILTQMVILPIMGIIAVTSEWSHRTAMVTFTLDPRRGRVVLAKLVGAVGLGLAAVVAALAFAALANLVGMLLRDGPGTWHLDWSALAGTIAVLVLSVAQGVGFGLLLLNTSLAIFCYFVLPTVWTVATSLVGFLREPAHWLDPGVAMAPLLAGHASAGELARISTATALWVAMPIVLGTWRVVRHDIK